MTDEAYPFYTIAEEFIQLRHIQQALSQTRQRLLNPAFAVKIDHIKAALTRYKQEFNFRLKRLEEHHQAHLTGVQEDDLAELKRLEQEAASRDPAPTIQDRLHADLSTSKQQWEERLKQEMGMHHILPTRPEEIYKVILIYLSIFKIHESHSHGNHCANLIEMIKHDNQEIKNRGLENARNFFKQQKNPKAAVALVESVVESLFGQAYLGAFVNIFTKFITYPVSDFLHFTGTHHYLPFPEEYVANVPSL